MHKHVLMGIILIIASQSIFCAPLRPNSRPKAVLEVEKDQKIPFWNQEKKNAAVAVASLVLTSGFGGFVWKRKEIKNWYTNSFNQSPKENKMKDYFWIIQGKPVSVPPAFKLTCWNQGVIGELLQRNAGMYQQASVEDKIQAAFEWGGFGDAFGDNIERSNRDRNSWNAFLQQHGQPAFTFRDVPHNLHGGGVRYSDDTAMTLVVAEKIIESISQGNSLTNRDSTLNPLMGNIAKAYLNTKDLENGWGYHADRCPGGSCMSAMTELQQRLGKSPDWWDTSATYSQKEQGGCGTVMRAHPWGLLLYKNPDLAAFYASKEARITHGADITIAGSAAMAAMVACAIQGQSIDTIIQQGIDSAQKYAPDAKGSKGHSYTTLVGMIEAAVVQGKIARECFLNSQEANFDQVVSNFYSNHTGWGADSAVACAVFGLIVHPDNPHRAVVMAANSLGTDADSIASMSGILVGAYTGVPLPSNEDLGGALEGRDTLNKLAKQFAEYAKTQG